jgi:hypothetical protein
MVPHCSESRCKLSWPYACCDCLVVRDVSSRGEQIIFGLCRPTRSSTRALPGHPSRRLTFIQRRSFRKLCARLQCQSSGQKLANTSWSTSLSSMRHMTQKPILLGKSSLIHHVPTKTGTFTRSPDASGGAAERRLDGSDRGRYIDARSPGRRLREDISRARYHRS